MDHQVFGWDPSENTRQNQSLHFARLWSFLECPFSWFQTSGPQRNADLCIFSSRIYQSITEELMLVFVEKCLHRTRKFCENWWSSKSWYPDVAVVRSPGQTKGFFQSDDVAHSMSAFPDILSQLWGVNSFKLAKSINWTPGLFQCWTSPVKIEEIPVFTHNFPCTKWNNPDCLVCPHLGSSSPATVTIISNKLAQNLESVETNLAWLDWLDTFLSRSLSFAATNDLSSRYTLSISVLRSWRGSSTRKNHSFFSLKLHTSRRAFVRPNPWILAGKQPSWTPW